MVCTLGDECALRWAFVDLPVEFTWREMMRKRRIMNALLRLKNVDKFFELMIFRSEYVFINI